MSSPAVRRTTARPSGIAARRDAILEAAAVLFTWRGYFQSQVADVAKQAGVAAGTVYLYFKSKDDLLVSIFNRTMKDVMAEARASLAGATCPTDRLRRIATLHLE